MKRAARGKSVRRRSRISVLTAAVLICLVGMGARAAVGEGDETPEAQIEQMIKELNLPEGETIRIPGSEEDVGLGQAVRRFSKGETFSPEAAVEELLRLFADEMRKLRALMGALMMPVLTVSLLMRLIDGGQSAAAVSRHVQGILLLVPVVSTVIKELQHTARTIEGVTQHMDKMLPLLLTMLTAVNGSVSSAFFHPVVAAASGTMVMLAREVILRLVMCACAVTTMNHLCDKAHLTKMAHLLRSVICWLLGVTFTVFLGASSVQGLGSAAIDGMGIRAAKYAADNFVPIVGGMFSDTMETLVGCSLVVKNALGLSALLVLAGVIASPMLHTLAVVLTMKICAALLEPVAERAVVDAIADFARLNVLFLITMLCVGTMYFLLITQMMLVGTLIFTLH